MKKIVATLILLFAVGYCHAQKEIKSTSSDPSILVGCWWVPHDATTQIHFRKDGTFLFNDVGYTILKGKYYFKKGVITLSYDDRKPQRFYIKYYMIGKEPYYTIYKKGYVFVKDTENKDCNW